MARGLMKMCDVVGAHLIYALQHLFLRLVYFLISCVAEKALTNELLLLSTPK